ncbi:putative Phage replication protein O domain protein [uncultured Thiomicrorhabdus sp.]
MSDFIPNSFQVPNVVIDEYLCKLSANAFKAYMFIVRKTKGWNKSSDGISQSQFMKALGVGSDNTVSKALDELLKFNLILEKKTQGRYSVFFIDVPAQNELLTSAESAEVPPQKVRNTSAESAEVPPQKVRTQTNTNQTNTNKDKKSKPKKSAGIDFSNALDVASESSLKNWIAHRQAIKKPMSQRAFDLSIQNFIKIGHGLGLALVTFDDGSMVYPVDQLIDYTIEAGWQSAKVEWIRNREATNQQKVGRSNAYPAPLTSDDLAGDW